MTKPTPKPLYVPAGANRLARVVGKKLAQVRKGRALSISQAAKQLGISGGHYKYLELGKITPGPNLSKRLLGWLTGTTYEDAPPVREGVYALDARKVNHRLVKAIIPKALAREFSRKCKTLGMSSSALIQLLIKQFVSNKASYAVLEEAIKEIKEAQVFEAMQESPELREVLKSDVALAIKAGAVMRPAKEELQAQAPILQLVAASKEGLSPSALTDVLEEDIDEDELS